MYVDDLRDLSICMAYQDDLIDNPNGVGLVMLLEISEIFAEKVVVQPVLDGLALGLGLCLFCVWV